MDSIEDRLEQALDDGLRMTFPASDPIAVSARGGDLEVKATGDDRSAGAGTETSRT
jgi:hypothetical protein